MAIDLTLARKPANSAPFAVPARRLLVIHNPVAGGARGGRLRAALERLAAMGCTVTVRPTDAVGAARRIAAAASPADFDVVAVAGGDGTMNEALNGLGDRSPALAILPLGTANVLAHEIGLGTAADRIAATLAGGPVAEVIPGEVNGRRFMLMCGVGFDAHVVENIDPLMKRRLGKGAYVWESLRQLAVYPFPAFRITVDGRPEPAASLIASRGRLYGGRFLLAPEAGLDRPALQATLFRSPGRLAAMRYAAALPLGLLSRLADAPRVAAGEIVVEGPPGDPVQGDGDVIAMLPARMTLASRPVRLVVPSGWPGA